MVTGDGRVWPLPQTFTSVFLFIFLPFLLSAWGGRRGPRPGVEMPVKAEMRGLENEQA